MKGSANAICLVVWGSEVGKPNNQTRSELLMMRISAETHSTPSTTTQQTALESFRLSQRTTWPTSTSIAHRS
jgi:hypothetical protein